MWARSPKLALSRRTLHYPRVDLDKHWNECGHDRPSWHYLSLRFTIQQLILTKIDKVDILQSGIGQILGKVCLIGGGLGPTLIRVGTIGGGFGPRLGKVDTMGLQQWTKWTLSGPNLDHNWAKWALSGPKSGVDMVQGWIWTHYRIVKVDDSSILSTKSRGQVGNSPSQVARADQF